MGEGSLFSLERQMREKQMKQYSGRRIKKVKQMVGKVGGKTEGRQRVEENNRRER